MISKHYFIYGISIPENYLKEWKNTISIDIISSIGRDGLEFHDYNNREGNFVIFGKKIIDNVNPRHLLLDNPIIIPEISEDKIKIIEYEIKKYFKFSLIFNYYFIANI